MNRTGSKRKRIIGKTARKRKRRKRDSSPILPNRKRMSRNPRPNYNLLQTEEGNFSKKSELTKRKRGRVQVTKPRKTRKSGNVSKKRKNSLLQKFSPKRKKKKTHDKTIPLPPKPRQSERRKKKKKKKKKKKTRDLTIPPPPKPHQSAHVHPRNEETEVIEESVSAISINIGSEEERPLKEKRNGILYDEDEDDDKEEDIQEKVSTEEDVPVDEYYISILRMDVPEDDYNEFMANIKKGEKIHVNQQVQVSPPPPPVYEEKSVSAYPQTKSVSLQHFVTFEDKQTFANPETSSVTTQHQSSTSDQHVSAHPSFETFSQQHFPTTSDQQVTAFPSFETFGQQHIPFTSNQEVSAHPEVISEGVSAIPVLRDQQVNATTTNENRMIQTNSLSVISQSTDVVGLIRDEKEEFPNDDVERLVKLFEKHDRDRWN